MIAEANVSGSLAEVLEHHFREATPDDLDHLLVLEHAAFDRPWPAGAFEQELALPQASVWLAFGGPADQPGREPMAYADFWVVEDEVSLLNIAVHPDHRRRGLASELLRLVERVGAERGGEQVFLEVRASNEPALALYRTHGYVQVGIRKGYYSSDGEDAIVMHRVLDDLP
jgi:ribosomal-protein-alanine N-acetyltransferase